MKIYTLRKISVICPHCELVFATTQVARKPAISTESKVEADLHRILPDAAIRAAALATCPECLYTWWISSFAQSFVLPQMAPDAPPVGSSKKFGHAILTGRKENAHALDKAVIALNGYWAAREEHNTGEKWLAMVVKELEEAMNDETWYGNRSRYSYILGEMFRLKADFVNSIRFFNQVDRKSVLPKELVDHQVQAAKQGNSNPVLIPPHIIQKVFKLKPKEAEPKKVDPENKPILHPAFINVQSPVIIA